jgi:hypothetical protein
VRHPVVNRPMSRWITSLLLVALAVRALVPAGFMPASDRPFSFQICPDAFPAGLLSRADRAHAAHEHGGHANHHLDEFAPSGADSSNGGSHEHGAARAEHCVFAAVASSAPIPHGFLLGAAPEAHAELLVTSTPPPASTQRFRLPPSRAPPPLS